MKGENGGGERGWSWRGSILPLAALHAIVEYRRSDRNPPPVTTAVVITNAVIYVRPFVLHELLPCIDSVAFNPHAIIKDGDRRRFLLSALYHNSEHHLLCNMWSLYRKGLQLEISMGSLEFACMIASLLGLSRGVQILLAKGLLFYFGIKYPYYGEYSVGFSGVLFAMKVILNAQHDSVSVNGVIFPSHLAAWADLFSIQNFMPHASFFGHLGGIIAGLLYVWLRDSFGEKDPVAAIIRDGGRILGRTLRFVSSLFRPQSPSISRSQSERRCSLGSFWRCQVCNSDNSGVVNLCEMCSTERSGAAFSLAR